MMEKNISLKKIVLYLYLCFADLCFRDTVARSFLKARDGNTRVALKEVLGGLFHKYCGFAVSEGEHDYGVSKVFIDYLHLDYKLAVLLPSRGGSRAVKMTVCRP